MSEPSFFQAVAQTPILQRALVAGALAGVSCAVLSPLVVLRRMAFVGDGMAHAAFGGIGLALFVLGGAKYDDLSVQFVTLGFCLALGIAVGLVSRTAGEGKIAEDSAIGIAFSVSMALGALLIALRQRRSGQYVPPMDYYLFGSLLNIGTNELVMLGLITLAVLGLMFLFHKEMMFYAFDARLAEVSGLNVGLFHYLFMGLLVMTVVISSRVVGIILVSASLVLPGVIALKLCRRLSAAMAVSAAAGVFSFELGMFASYEMQVHPGSAIVLIQFVMLLLASAAQLIHKRHTSQKF